jgi:hypothetical protein
MVEMEGAPGGFQSWDATIRRRFQPAMHTRVGGVALFSPGLVPTYHGVASVLRTKLITNPYAKIYLPEWIETPIAAPGER